MRLIDADEHECWACTHHATGQCDTWCDHGESFELRKDVAEAKTVDAVPVVHAKWIAQNDALTRFMCSSCKSENHEGFETYCPKCGALMDLR